MTDAPKLREVAQIAETHFATTFGTDRIAALRRAADALDAKDGEIALLKEGREHHDAWADHLEHELAQQSALLAQATAALERAVLMLSIMKDAGEFQCSDTLKDCCEALAAIRAKETP